MKETEQQKKVSYHAHATQIKDALRKIALASF
jgi:hypothetical protein